MTILQGLNQQPLLIASHNPGKVREIEALLAPFSISVSSAAQHGLAEPEETGSSFLENARIKSRTCMEQTGLPALSDDSGLSVDALGSAPGIYSARWAGAEKDFTAAMQRIEEELHAKHIPEKDWTAHFVCALSLCLPEGKAIEFEGIVHGHLTFPPRGTHGFGYDPIFIPDGYALTFGEMEPAAKHLISHRARAFAQLVAYLENQERVGA